MLKWIFSLLLLSASMDASVKAILTDIEGTTTSISFVHDILFPYAKCHVRKYLLQHQKDPDVMQIMKEISKTADINLEEISQTILSWIEQDKKITPLKTLQGMMWKEGYLSGAFHGHVYKDAFEEMCRWHQQKIPLYVYSSGSVAAQKLLFGFSTFGDMTSLFSDYFDTNVGGKRETASYLKIANNIGVVPESILFLSDTPEELAAAKEAGMQTILLLREKKAAPDNCRF